MFGHIFHKKQPSTEVKKKSKPAVSMVPLFSRRTLLVVIIGLILGILLAFGYWVMSPSLGSSGTQSAKTGGANAGTESTGLFGMLGMKVSGPFQSKVSIQVVNPGSSYMDLKELQSKAEYYAAKAKSLPFFEFLTKELARLDPTTSYTVDELDRIITTEYDWSSQLPAIRITATGDTENEAGFLASSIPEAFQNYLIAEENAERQKKYQNTLGEIDTVKAALLKAGQELQTLHPDDILNNPEYIALNARINALETEVENQATTRASLIATGGDTQGESEKIQEQMKIVSQKLAEAEQELSVLVEAEISSDVSHQSSYIELTAKITALQGQLTTLMTGWTEGTTRYMGLAEMIAKGITSGTDYTSRLEDIERTTSALSEAQKELSIEESHSGVNSAMTIDHRFAQIKIDTLNAELTALRERQNTLTSQSIDGDSQSNADITFTKTTAALADVKKELANLESTLGYDRLTQDLEYKVAQDKVNELNTRLEDLTQQLGSLVGQATDPSEITGYLIAGKPLKPSPIIPERPKASKTLMMGAILGIVIAWLILNIRWIAKGMPSSTSNKDEDNISPEPPDE